MCNSELSREMQALLYLIVLQNECVLRLRPLESVLPRNMKGSTSKTYKYDVNLNADVQFKIAICTHENGSVNLNLVCYFVRILNRT